MKRAYTAHFWTSPDNCLLSFSFDVDLIVSIVRKLLFQVQETTLKTNGHKKFTGKILTDEELFQACGGRTAHK